MSDLLNTLKQEVIQAGLRRGVSLKAMTDIANSVDERIRRDFGGSKPYVSATDKAKRNSTIMNDFNGRNHHEVCRKHKISRRTLNRIVSDSYGNR